MNIEIDLKVKLGLNLMYLCSVQCELAYGMIKSMIMKWTIMDIGLKVYQFNRIYDFDIEQQD